MRRGRKSHDFAISECYCTKCGNKGLPIARKNGSYREPGHLKKLYCPFCKETINHVEIRPFYSDYNYEDFQLELKGKNFDENGNRIRPYREFRNLKMVETVE